MKSLLFLWKKIADDSAIRCHTSATHDFKTVMARTKHEGLSFLTITLPDFGKAFEICLDQGQVCPHLFPAFKAGRGGPHPVFLGGYLGRVFDRTSGELLDDPCVDSILAIRQLTLMFGKILLPCSDARVRDAIRGYVECEQDVRERDRERTPFEYESFHRMSRMLYASMLAKVDKKIHDHEYVPKHGPGSTADGLMGNQKYDLRQWTSRLEEIFPVGEMLLPNWSYYDLLDEIDILEPGREEPVEVLDVPKTLKTPRIIAREPTAMMYAQQAIKELIEDGIKGSYPINSMIGTDDQEPNKLMAREGSLNSTLATLDLSEASDRVSNELIRTMMSDHPYLDRAVQASRSRSARVPGHGVIPLAKFASMGSALTFPLEAMVFLTVTLLGIEQALNSTLAPRDVQQFVGQVRIYGDDIIIPVDYVDCVVRQLETFGFKVNERKSFWNGKFRESCGGDYYAGSDVSIVRVRNVLPSRRTDATGVISMVSLRNQLYFHGYWGTVKWLDEEIRRVIKHFPTVLPTSPVQGRHSVLGYETQFVDDRLHAPFVRGYVVSNRIPKNSLEGPGALLKYFLKRGSLPAADRNHLERSGRPVAVDIKLRNASAI
jgi:hypothetical protein